MKADREPLHVRQFRAQYLISSQHPSPESVRARLDEAVLKSLPQALSNVVSQLFSITESSIWLIHRLVLEIDVNAALDREQVARRWARQITRAFSRVLRDGEDGQNVVRFESRDAYLARFLVDLADGCAWGKWYYATFDGLRVLPVSAAIRTAICDDPGTGLSALQKLPVNGLKSVLRVLAGEDARRILDSVGQGPLAGDEMRCFHTLWECWGMPELEPWRGAGEWRNALQLYVGACRTSKEVSGSTLRAAALALTRLARRLISDSMSQRERLLSALCSGDLASLYITAGSNDAEILAPLTRCPPHWIQEISGILLSRRSGNVTHEPAKAATYRHTPFGGVFLLSPFLDALPVEEATNDWPEPENSTASALVRFLLLAKCCGHANADRFFCDGVVRDLMGIRPPLSVTDVARWQTRISWTALERFLQRIGTWQRECGAVGGHTLALSRISLRGRPVAVIVDCQRGVLLFAASYHSGGPDRAVERVREWLYSSDLAPTVLFGEDIFARALRAAFPGVTIEEVSGSAVDRMIDEDKAVGEILARLNRMAEDFSHLALPRSFRVSRSVDLALDVAAQGLLRAFAWCLPGFARSGLPYLYDNFLDFSASIEDEPGRRIVRLGRPPLNIVLSMTGMNRKRYGLSWLDERPFALFQEG